MGGRAPTDITSFVFFLDVRAPRYVTCVSHSRGALASVAM
jgi:hypothetical protein